MPSYISAGSVVDSSANVGNPTVLSPTLPGTRANGDWLWCFTESTAHTATVSISAGWATIYDVTATNAHFAAFACKVTGSEAAPTVTWSGLTTGSSGTPCIAVIQNLGTGWREVTGALVIDAMSDVSAYSSATVHAGGAAFYTTVADTWVMSIGLRRENDVGGVAIDAGGSPVYWTLIAALATTSGADLAYLRAMGLGPSGVGGLVTEHSWTVNGTAVESKGFMVAMALEPLPGEAGPLIYTRGRAPG